jgi:mRNA interferase MazF
VNQQARSSGKVGPRVIASETYQPDRGHFIYVNFTPNAGHEQGGRRPALILSPRDYNIKTGLAIACPITNQAKSYPFEVPIPRGAKLTGVILADHVKNIDWIARQATFHGVADEDTVLQVLARIEALLQIDLDS